MSVALALVDRLGGIARRLGVDHTHLRTLLAVTLTLDARRRHGWIQGSKRITPHRWSLIVHAVMGLWLAALPTLVPSAFTAITLGLTVVMAMLAFDLVADYSAVLLDGAEATVIAARPVAPRTILVARLLHVGIYLATYAAALTLATLAAGTWRWGPLFLPAYLVGLAGALVLVLAAVALVYLVLMRAVSAERLRDAAMWAQLVMTALTIGAYAVTSFVDFRGAAGIEGRPWLLVYPPAWMASFPALAADPSPPYLALLATLGLVAPIALGAAAVRLAPGFRVELPPAARSRRRPRAPREPWLARLVVRATGSHVARAVTTLVWLLTARDRSFKTRTHPVLVAVVLFVAAFGLLARAGVWREALGDVAATDMHLFLLYYVIVVLPTPLLMVAYADRPEAAWILRAMPIAAPGTVLIATLTVLFVRFLLPVYGAAALVVLVIWGARVVADVALAFATTALVATGMTIVAGRRLPFAAPPPGGGGGTTAGVVVGGMLLVLLLATVHWVLRRPELPLPQPWPVLAAVPVVLALAGLVGWRCAATGWDAVPDRSAS